MHVKKQLSELSAAGWKVYESPRNREKVAQGASLQLGYDTPSGDLVDLYYFEDKNLLRLVIHRAQQNDPRWFQLEIDDRLDQLLELLSVSKDDISLANYFSFYFQLQNVAEVSILAWEQWEG